MCASTSYGGDTALCTALFTAMYPEKDGEDCDGGRRLGDPGEMCNEGQEMFGGATMVQAMCSMPYPKFLGAKCGMMLEKGEKCSSCAPVYEMMAAKKEKMMRKRRKRRRARQAAPSTAMSATRPSREDHGA